MSTKSGAGQAVLAAAARLGLTLGGGIDGGEFAGGAGAAGVGQPARFGHFVGGAGTGGDEAVGDGSVVDRAGGRHNMLAGVPAAAGVASRPGGGGHEVLHGFDVAGHDSGEVERMMAEAERHRAEDKAVREAVDARNELDSVAYQVERRLAELGDAAAAHDRARAEMLINDARDAVKNEAPLDRVRSLTAELQQLYHGLAAARPSGNGHTGPREDSGGAGTQPASDEDVIDAEFDRS
jgi:hypothetical protein